jgi:hypothetical protein
MRLLILLLSALAPSSAYAALGQIGNNNPAVANMWDTICRTLPFCGLNAATAPNYFAGKVIAIIASLISVVAIIMIIYASLQLSTSQTDEAKIGEAKKIITYAVVGLILAIVGGTFLQYLIRVVFPQLFNG